MAEFPGDQPLQDLRSAEYQRPNERRITFPASTDVDGSDRSATAPTMRSRRGVFTFAMTAFTVGAILILYASPWRHEFLVPGNLTSHHAQILADAGADRCAACHQNANDGLAGWTAGMVSGHPSASDQSELCMECHRDSINFQFALSPHNAPKSTIEKSSAKFQTVSFGRKFQQSMTGHIEQIACIACHREHKGNHDLTAMTDAQCQNCHSEVFHSFEAGHPEFTNWPTASRQRIAFDHASHGLKHFPGKQMTFDCQQCHVPDDSRDGQRLASFEVACAHCHEQQIVSGSNPIAMFALPMLDMEAIEGANLSAGSWPLSATGDFDGDVPPMMRLLLMADDEANAILTGAGPSFSFADVDRNDSGAIADAVTLAWSIKRLLFDLTNGGRAEIQRRLSLALGRTIADSETDSLVAGLGKMAFASAAGRWLPQLEQEIRTRPVARTRSDSSATARGPLRRSDEILARMIMQESLAENPIAGTSRMLAPKTEAAKLNVESSVTDAARTNHQSAASRKMASTRQPRQTLADNPLASAGGRSTFTPALAESSPAKKSDATPASDARRPATLPTVMPLFRQSDNRQLLQTAWTRDDQSFRIAYTPQNHQDEFLRSWIELIASVPGVRETITVAALFDSLTDEHAPGNCRSCHTMSQSTDDTLSVHWKPFDRHVAGKGFTTFSHRPHLIQGHLQDCRFCHEMDESRFTSASFTGDDPHQFESNFVAIKKANCASCHQSGLANNSCTTCHNYHVSGHSNLP